MLMNGAKFGFRYDRQRRRKPDDSGDAFLNKPSQWQLQNV
jgi:hypothetical protein